MDPPDRYPESSLREGLVEALVERTPAGQVTPERLEFYRCIVGDFLRDNAELVELAYRSEEVATRARGRPVPSLESIADDLVGPLIEPAGVQPNPFPLYKTGA